MSIDGLFNQVNSSLYLTSPKRDFEQVYVALRAKEGRIPSDELVQSLPYVSNVYPHANEWKRRTTSCNKLLKYIEKESHLAILEIGCGNGWFSHKMLKENNRVVGIDVGEEELQQAQRCFQHPNLRYFCCDDLSLLPKKSFNLIVFNASLQYMQLKDEFWQLLFSLLKPKGEIHILDTPIYTEEEAILAKERTKKYYDSMQVDLFNYYFHVCWKQLPRPFTIEYQPLKYLTKVIPWYSPFPWVIIPYTS